MCAAAVCLAACSQDETFEQVNADSHMISFRASLPQDAMMTKADNNVKRYIMQVVKPDGGWLDFDPSEEVETPRQTNATGEFQIDGEALGMEIGGTYTALFWADYDDGVYGTDWLNWVSWEDTSKPMTMAYCSKLEFVYGEGTETDIVLKRAVAQVNLKQNSAYIANAGDKITVSYKSYTAFNILGSKVDGLANENIDVEIGITEGDIAVDTNLGQILTFATPVADQSTMMSFTFTYNDTKIADVANVPLKANYQTNIKGNFAQVTDYNFSTSTDDGEWGGSQDVEMGSEETTPDTAKPTFGECSATADGATINYSIEVNDETSLNGGRIEIHLKKNDSSWTQIGETVTVNFDEQTGTTKTVTGSFTVTTSGTYIVDWTAWDAAGNEEYKNVTDIVVTVAGE